jgi:hypothetical protein
VLITAEGVPLLLGTLQIAYPPGYLIVDHLQITALLLFFCLGVDFVLVAIFLNQIVPVFHRGRVAGVYTALTLVAAAGLSLLWQTLFFSQLALAGDASALVLFAYVSGGSALLILFGLMSLSVVRPWRKHARTYMVPGSIKPYIVWWIVYCLAFGLYSFASPPQLRFLFAGFPVFQPAFARLSVELVWIAVGCAALVFAFVPDWIGRKRTFSIASFLLGEVCIFAGARTEALVAMVLMASEVLVIGFMLGVGVWLVWAEVGAVRLKGRRAAAGWTPALVVGFLIWYCSVPVGPSLLDLGPSHAGLLYALAATMVLATLFPLTNAVESLLEERTIEDLEIRVDTGKVQRAVREIEVETPLESVREELETELARLARIHGVDRSMARALTNQGYDTPELVARATPAALAAALGISEDEAAQIKASAQKLAASASHHGINRAARKTRKRAKKSKGVAR